MTERDRRPIVLPDPVPVDPAENVLGAIEDMGDAFDPQARVGGIFNAYDIIGADILDLVRLRSEAELARLRAPVDPPEHEPVVMALCEPGHIILRPNVLYRFEPVDGCAECAEIVATYAGHEWTVEGSVNPPERVSEQEEFALDVVRHMRSLTTADELWAYVTSVPDPLAMLDRTLRVRGERGGRDELREIESTRRALEAIFPADLGFSENFDAFIAHGLLVEVPADEAFKAEWGEDEETMWVWRWHPLATSSTRKGSSE